MRYHRGICGFRRDFSCPPPHCQVSQAGDVTRKLQLRESGKRETIGTMNDNEAVKARVMWLNGLWFALSMKKCHNHKEAVKIVKREMKACGYPVPKDGTNIKLLNAYTKFLKSQNIWVSIF